MTAHTIFRPTTVDSIKFGGTDFSSGDYTSTTVALDTAFATNNPGTPESGSATTAGIVRLDLVGAQANTSGTASAAYSESFAKEITFSGNERSTSADNLLGADSDGTQNQEVTISPTTLVSCEMTIVYRNPVPSSIFNDDTKCCLMVMDNSESDTSGVLNIGCRTITVLHVGGLTLTPEGMMEQKVKFSFKGGTTGDSIVVSTGSETWYKVKGGSYVEEIRTA